MINFFYSNSKYNSHILFLDFTHQIVICIDSSLFFVYKYKFYIDINDI